MQTRVIRLITVCAVLLVAGAVLLMPAGHLVRAQDQNNIGVNWTGYYWNNQTFSGNYTLTRLDPVINFNWATGSPDASIPADHFSVRWYTTINVTAGSYHFRAGADDGIRLAVDGVKVIDIFTDAINGFQVGTADVQLGAGNHQVIVDYYENVGNAGVQVTIVPSSAVPPTVGPTPVTTVVPNVPGQNIPVTILPVRARVIPTTAIVRAGPDLSFQALAEVQRGNDFVVVARNGDGLSAFYLVDLGGSQGWLYRRDIYLYNGDINSLPNSDTTFTAPPGFNNMIGVVRNETTVYDGPTRRNSSVVGVLPAGQRFQILRVSRNRAWLFINADGLQGWVFILEVRFVSGKIERLPIGN